MTNIAKLAQAVLLMQESPQTCNAIAIATGIGPEQAREWMNKLTDSGIAKKTSVPNESNLGRKNINAWQILRNKEVRHFCGCWQFGPDHYWCALDEIHRLQDEANAKTDC